ncbi:PREDICTED: uncharacterized protein LOC100635299 isoform X4 [Amphimedon queenslandica]|uniref:C1q domain-containing protein n=1 Tax=Amphimedon queenslandica TaxID=400682 RepID=A0AAN0IAJ9_AMPQE|nr:PREDICTED: uncharacterized protein LOC100635299 isoform X4 [Amphimedon queenslandica]|eukprot:XP_003384044.1 PREDICTED: uncharacterized protein LOC100635299 isoform X4 [Amphimedon queenslandica]
MILFVVATLVLQSYSRSTMASSNSPIKVSMSCSRVMSKLNCDFDYTNTASEDYYVGEYFTPLEGIYNRFLTITYQDGTDVPYMGILAGRVAATKENFKLIKAGETISASVDLTEAYTFDKDGTYTIVYDRPLAYLSASEMSNIVKDEELPQGGWNDVVLAKVEINLANTRDLAKPRFD